MDDITYEFEEVPLSNLKSMYRNLRENYEYRLRYDEGEIFHEKRNEKEIIEKDNNSLKASGVKQTR